MNSIIWLLSGWLCLAQAAEAPIAVDPEPEAPFSATDFLNDVRKHPEDHLPLLKEWRRLANEANQMRDGWGSWKRKMLFSNTQRLDSYEADRRKCEKKEKFSESWPQPELQINVDRLYELGSLASGATGIKPPKIAEQCDLAYGYWRQFIDLMGFNIQNEAAQNRLQQAYFHMGMLSSDDINEPDRDQKDTYLALSWFRMLDDETLKAKAQPRIRELNKTLAEKDCERASDDLKHAGEDARRLRAVRLRAQSLSREYAGASPQTDACARKLLEATENIIDQP